MSAQLRVTADATLDAGEYAWWWTPRTGRGATKYPMLALHGAGFLTGDNFAAPTGWPDAADLVRAVARGSAQTGNKGIPVASHYLNGDKYANDTVMSRIDLMRTSIATRTGCSSTKVNLFGISMGGGAAVRYAALNPSKVASINVIIPMMSIINLRNSNMGAGSLIGGFANVITAAWGATYSTGYTVTLTNGSTAVTATAGTFTSGQTGYAVIKNTAIRQSADTTVPFGTTFTFATSTTGTLSAAFTGTTGSYATRAAQRTDRHASRPPSSPTEPWTWRPSSATWRPSARSSGTRLTALSASGFPASPSTSGPTRRSRQAPSRPHRRRF
jgi:hypothetical protein